MGELNSKISLIVFLHVCNLNQGLWPSLLPGLSFRAFLGLKERDKKAYLSSLGLADIIVVTCDSTSMISEAAITGKPIYIVNMKNRRSNYRFKKFYHQFKEMKIIRDLDGYKDNIDLWTYKQLDESKRIAPIVKERMKKNGII